MDEVDPALLEGSYDQKRGVGGEGGMILLGSCPGSMTLEVVIGDRVSQSLEV